MADFFSLGSIQQSILAPKDFLDLPENKGKWILMDGQSIHGSDLWKLTQMENVPDGRGVFIRSMNLGRDVNTGDSSGDRAVGSYQPDNFKYHAHPMNFNLGIQPGWAGGWGPVGSKHPGNSPGDPGWDHHNLPVGGEETQPRNIALYLYIKINNS